MSTFGSVAFIARLLARFEMLMPAFLSIVTIRPEQIRLGGSGEAGTIAATITNLVYFGTDTHCHADLADGSEVMVRLQSPASGEVGLVIGQRVGLRLQPGAAQVLED